MKYEQLNRYDIAPDDERYSDAWRRVLARLGDYTAIIVQSLNVRPSAVTLLAQTSSYVLVRLSTPSEHVVLRIAPEGDLGGEIYFGRMLTAHQLPTARIVHYDLTGALVPFNYMLESYIGGVSALQLHEPHFVRDVARQVGRTLRRIHRIGAHGWGRPNAAGRWPTPDWQTVLRHLHATFVLEPADALVFAEAERAAVTALLEHPDLNCSKPNVMHGNIGPHTARCTTGEHVQLEALFDPGATVGGDGLLDLALGMDPAYPAEWRTGLLEGYAAVMPLTPIERERLRLFQILTCYWHACRRYMLAEPHESARDQVLALLEA